MRSAASVLALAAALRCSTGFAQTEDALAAARRLFAEAVADEDAKRYDTALQEFQQVSSVRETANVRYRIATCLDALGRTAEALAAYDATVRLGADDASAADALQAARARAAQLDPIVPRLTVVMPADAPAGTEMRMDDVLVERDGLSAPLPVDAGHHTLRVTAPGRVPFETAVMVQPGARVAITIVLPPAGRTTPTDAGPRSTVPAAAWIAVGVGGALAVGSVVSLALRDSSLSTLSADCPSSTSSGVLRCPNADRSAVDSARGAAEVEGPLAVGFAAGAVAALGIGTWLLLSTRGRDPSSAVVAPLVTARGGGLVVRGAFGL